METAQATIDPLTEQTVRHAEKALDLFNTERSKLFTSTGKPVYGEERHTASLNALQSELSSAFSEADSALTSRIDALQKKASLIENQDMILMLKRDDLDYANAVRPFIKEAVEDAHVQELEKMLSHALESKDRIRLLLFARYLPKRLLNKEMTSAGLAKLAFEATQAVAPDLSEAGRLREQVNAAQMARYNLIKRRDAATGASDVARNNHRQSVQRMMNKG